MRDLLLFQANKSLSEQPGRIDPWLHLQNDGNTKGSCCDVLQYCEFPRGRQSGYRNPSHWSTVQGCVWNWEKALRWVNNVDAKNEPEERDLYYYISKRKYRELLGIVHPVKTHDDCKLKIGGSWGNFTVGTSLL